MCEKGFRQKTKRCRKAIREFCERHGDRLCLSDGEIKSLMRRAGSLMTALEYEGKKGKGIRDAARAVDEACE